MEETGVKALLIGVSIFITLIIVTVVIMEFFQIGEIYKSVGETNVSFESKFDEFSKFNDSNNIFNGVNVKNYIKKYKNDDSVDVCINSICNDNININIINNSDEYTPTLEETNKGYKIVFSIRK